MILPMLYQISVAECRSGASILGKGNRRIQVCMPPNRIRQHLLDEVLGAY